MASVKEALEELVKKFDSDAAKDWDRVIQITIAGEGGGAWHIVVKDQKCSLHEGEHGSPDLKLDTDVDTWTGLLSGKVDGMSAYMSGQLKAEGDMSDLMKIGSVFPGLF